MTEQTLNPYAAPGASISPAFDSDTSFAPFPRFSAWWVFLLTILTFGVYAYYWMFTRSNVINRHYPDHAIPAGLIWTALTVFAAQFIVGFWIGFTTTADPAAVGALAWLDPLLSILGAIMWLAWIFAIRNRVNRVSGANAGEKFWAGGVLTFFFSVLYLAFKINQIKDSE